MREVQSKPAANRTIATDIITSTILNFTRRSGISRSQVYVLLGRGELESAKVGGSRLIIEDSYHRLLDRSRVLPKHKPRATQ
jgi:hypothetical protein